MKRKSLSFSQYLFFSVIAIYCVFVASFLYYQYHREKTHKVELLNSTLTMFNVDLYDHMADTAFSVKNYVARYRIRHHLQKLRVTLVDRHGKFSVTVHERDTQFLKMVPYTIARHIIFH